MLFQTGVASPISRIASLGATLGFTCEFWSFFFFFFSSSYFLEFEAIMSRS
jgi:hypothetical protein